MIGLRKVSARFLCEVLYASEANQAKFCEIFNIGLLAGRIAINSIPLSFHNYISQNPQLIESISLAPFKDQQASNNNNGSTNNNTKSPSICWYISVSHLETNDLRPQQIFKQANQSLLESIEDFIDPANTLFGVSVQSKPLASTNTPALPMRVMEEDSIEDTRKVRSFRNSTDFSVQQQLQQLQQLEKTPHKHSLFIKSPNSRRVRSFAEEQLSFDRTLVGQSNQDSPHKKLQTSPNQLSSDYTVLPFKHLSQHCSKTISPLETSQFRIVNSTSIHANKLSQHQQQQQSSNSKQSSKNPAYFQNTATIPHHEIFLHEKSNSSVQSISEETQFQVTSTSEAAIQQYQSVPSQLQQQLQQREHLFELQNSKRRQSQQLLLSTRTNKANSYFVFQEHQRSIKKSSLASLTSFNSSRKSMMSSSLIKSTIAAQNTSTDQFQVDIENQKDRGNRCTIRTQEQMPVLPQNNSLRSPTAGMKVIVFQDSSLLTYQSPAKSSQTINEQQQQQQQQQHLKQSQMMRNSLDSSSISQMGSTSSTGQFYSKDTSQNLKYRNNNSTITNGPIYMELKNAGNGPSNSQQQQQSQIKSVNRYGQQQSQQIQRKPNKMHVNSVSYQKPEEFPQSNSFKTITQSPNITQSVQSAHNLSKRSSVITGEFSDNMIFSEATSPTTVNSSNYHHSKGLSMKSMHGKIAATQGKSLHSSQASQLDVKKVTDASNQEQQQSTQQQSQPQISQQRQIQPKSQEVFMLDYQIQSSKAKSFFNNNVLVSPKQSQHQASTSKPAVSSPTLITSKIRMTSSQITSPSNAIKEEPMLKQQQQTKLISPKVSVSSSITFNTNKSARTAGAGGSNYDVKSSISLLRRK